MSDSFSTDQKFIEIKLDVKVELFDVETAIPLGLIVNELVTNSIKYAFIGRDHGLIRVKLWQNDNNQLCLEVADDGTGLVHSEQAKKNSFGSDLIRMLSQKLKGTIEISTAKGYMTLITFNRFSLLS